MVRMTWQVAMCGVIALALAACGSSSGGSSGGGGSTAPTVTAVADSAGSTVGGTAVTLTGTNFVTGNTTVQFGGVAALAVNVVSATQLTCTTPAHAAGAVDVTATTPDGTGTLTGGFTYRPVIDALIGSRQSGTQSGVFLFRDILNTTGLAADAYLDNAGSGIDNGGRLAIWNDRLVVSNRNNDTVRIFNSIPALTDGQAADVVLSGFSNPNGCYVSPAGDLYVTDRSLDQVWIYRDITTLTTGDGPDAVLSMADCPVQCLVDGTRLFVSLRCESTASVLIYDNAAGLVGGEAPTATLDINSPRRMRVHQNVLWVRGSNQQAMFGFSNPATITTGTAATHAVFGLVPLGDRGDMVFNGSTGWLCNQYNNQPVLTRIALTGPLVTMAEASVDEDTLNEDAMYDVEVAANTLVSTARDTGFAVIYRDAAALSTNQAPDDFLFDPRMSNVKEIRLIVR